jgi:hypothetical protein
MPEKYETDVPNWRCREGVSLSEVTTRKLSELNYIHGHNICSPEYMVEGGDSHTKCRRVYLCGRMWNGGVHLKLKKGKNRNYSSNAFCNKCFEIVFNLLCGTGRKEVCRNIVQRTGDVDHW